MENQKSWFKRNWIWAVPGCGCLAIILLIVFGVGAAFFGITNLIENSSPHNHAVEKAINNPKLIAQLGESIETTWMMNGSVTIENDNGTANYSIPLKGSKGKGTLFVIAEKIDGKWVYEELYIIIKETQERINLLNQSLEVI